MGASLVQSVRVGISILLVTVWGMVVVCNDCKTQEDMDEEYGDEE